MRGPLRLGQAKWGVLAVLLLAPGLALAAGGGGHHGDLHINWWTWDMDAPPVGWFLLDFALFGWGLWYFAKKPIRQAFAERHRRIKRALSEADEILGRAKSRFEEYRKKLAHVDEEMTLLVERGRENGELEHQQLVKAGDAFATRLKRDAKTVVQQELEKAHSRLRRETAELALQKTEAVLRGKLTGEDKARLLEQAIADLEHEAEASGGGQP